ncbi:hypothetical protein DMC63_35745 [Streptomyces sp. WAC 05977]|nr:hypothetical protein DMC63_35745 [Streptomyces sp. WAC 05977]
MLARLRMRAMRLVACVPRVLRRVFQDFMCASVLDLGTDTLVDGVEVLFPSRRRQSPVTGLW